MNKFQVSYVSTKPKEGNSPRVKITGDKHEEYKIYFHEKNLEDFDYNIIVSGICKTNQIFIGPTKQWFGNWFIQINNSNGDIVFTDRLSLKNKIVCIKMDAYALGDTIAWIPYVEEFRKRHECTIICSTFHNDLLIKAYPDILFIKPNITIDNIYAQYYIGAQNDNNILYSPLNVNDIPLQMVATSILGLKFNEIKPNLTSNCEFSRRRINGKYVTLSEFGSSDIKEWKHVNGWQTVVDFLVDNGYKVVVISKEKTNLNNVIDLSGDYSLSDRMVDIYHADFHMGVSSGLSWLAWSLNTHVVLVSDVTPTWHEFTSDITRITSNNINTVNYDLNEDNITNPDLVINEIKKLISN